MDGTLQHLSRSSQNTIIGKDVQTNSINSGQHSPHLQGELTARTANDYGANSIKAHAYPGLARTNVAATPDKPEGTAEDGWAEKHKHLTVMQQHCVYWDADGDGVIWPQDTYNGCRAWGWNILLSAIATFLINGNLSYPTQAGILPDPYVWLRDSVPLDR